VCVRVCVCVIFCCSVTQCVAVLCNLYPVAMMPRSDTTHMCACVLCFVAVCYSVLQCFAFCCSGKIQRTCVRVCYSLLQYAAVCCSALHFVAVARYNTRACVSNYCLMSYHVLQCPKSTRICVSWLVTHIRKYAFVCMIVWGGYG